MIRALGPLIACFMMLAIVACGGSDPVADGANNTAGLPDVNKSFPNAIGSPPENGTVPATSATESANSVDPPKPAEKIPAALQGRWGLAPRDCTSTAGDAKGLLVISQGELRFYESRAVPSANVETNADSISGDFDFTGEGQRWTKYEALTLQKDGLVRTESNPMASFTYAKCR